jgi:hypothetical protein
VTVMGSGKGTNVALSGWRRCGRPRKRPDKANVTAATRWLGIPPCPSPLPDIGRRVLTMPICACVISPLRRVIVYPLCASRPSAVGRKAQVASF